MRFGAPVPADWWRLLGSAELDAVIAEALDGNLDLAAARARLLQAPGGGAEAGGPQRH